MGEWHRVAVVAACVLLLALWEAPRAVGAPDWHACPGWANQPSQTSLRNIVFSTVCLLDAERAQYGLKPLRWNWRLWWAGQQMANDMVAHHFFSHDSPDGPGLQARVAATGYLPPNGNWDLGENLAWGQGPLTTPAAIVFAWMTSPGHRANILEPDFRDIGIGITIGSPGPNDGDGVVYVAEFGRNLQRQ
jgi:uncharacterized protein YkwD